MLVFSLKGFSAPVRFETPPVVSAPESASLRHEPIVKSWNGKEGSSVTGDNINVGIINVGNVDGGKDSVILIPSVIAVGRSMDKVGTHREALVEVHSEGSDVCFIPHVELRTLFSGRWMGKIRLKKSLPPP